jgi:hypothetical protein
VDLSRINMVFIGLGMVALFVIAAYGNASIKEAERERDTSDLILGRCALELSDTGVKLANAMRDRDYWLAKSSETSRLMQSASARETETSFMLLRAGDSVKALQTEVAKLKASNASLQAIAVPKIETGSIAKPKRKKKPAPVTRRAPCHHCWW